MRIVKNVLIAAAVFVCAVFLLACTGGENALPTPNPTAEPLKTQVPALSAAVNETAQAASSNIVFIGEKDVNSVSFEKILKKEYNGAKRMDDGKGTYVFKLESGELFTFLISEGNLTSGIDLGQARLIQTGESAFLALWRINDSYTVSISGNKTTLNDMTEFLNTFCI